MKNNNNIKSEDMICPICGEKMKEHDYIYDRVKDEKIYYKCGVCGHIAPKVI